MHATVNNALRVLILVLRNQRPFIENKQLHTEIWFEPEFLCVGIVTAAAIKPPLAIITQKIIRIASRWISYRCFGDGFAQKRRENRTDEIVQCDRCACTREISDIIMNNWRIRTSHISHYATAAMRLFLVCCHGWVMNEQTFLTTVNSNINNITLFRWNYIYILLFDFGRLFGAGKCTNSF